MALFKSKEEKTVIRNEKERRKQFAAEKAASYEGESLQIIGKIPKAVSVKLSLRPEEKLLNINYKAIDITLPYERIIGFDSAVESSDTTGKGTEFAKKLFSGGRGVIGVGGNLISGMIARTKLVVTIGRLRYYDKSGVERELDFMRKRECSYDNFEPDNDQDFVTSAFETVIGSIVANHGVDITEL